MKSANNPSSSTEDRLCDEVPEYAEVRNLLETAKLKASLARDQTGVERASVLEEVQAQQGDACQTPFSIQTTSV